MKTDVKRVAIYLAFAFGIAWGIALVLYLTGGLANSPLILRVPGTQGGLTLAVVLMAGGYMMAPALAHVLVRLVTREGWQGAYLQPHLRQGWPYWLATWFLPAVLTVLGMAIYFVLFPQHFDPSLGTLREMIEQSMPAGQALPVSPWVIVVAQTAQAVLLAPLLNAVFTFGEEFGWAGYLQPRLLPLGERRALLITGLVWGVWHWPVIAMGHNYGLQYPGFPWTGLLLTLWVMALFRAFLGWASWRGGSVWPAVIGHGALNGIAGLGILMVRGQPLALLGPTPAGLIGSLPWALMALAIFITPGAWAIKEKGQDDIQGIAEH